MLRVSCWASDRRASREGEQRDAGATEFAGVIQQVVTGLAKTGLY